MKHTYTLSIEISPGGFHRVKTGENQTLQLRYMMMMVRRCMASNVINQWLINNKSSTILEAIT